MSEPPIRTQLEELLERQELKFQEWRDRISNLPEWMVRGGHYSAVHTAIIGIGKMHSAISAVVTELEDEHWRLCAQWLLAERDWKASAA